MKLVDVLVDGVGFGKQDADGVRVDDRNDGDISFSAVNSVFVNVGADGVELDEGNDGSVFLAIMSFMQMAPIACPGVTIRLKALPVMMTGMPMSMMVLTLMRRAMARLKVLSVITTWSTTMMKAWILMKRMTVGLMSCWRPMSLLVTRTRVSSSPKKTAEASTPS